MKHDVRLLPLLPSNDPQLYARVLQDVAQDVVLLALTGTDPQAYPRIIQYPPFIEGSDPPEPPGDPVAQSPPVPVPSGTFAAAPISLGITAEPKPPLVVKDPHGLLSNNPAQWPEELKRAIALCCCGDDGSSSGSGGGLITPSACVPCAKGEGPTKLRLRVNFAGDCSGGYLISGTGGGTCLLDPSLPRCSYFPPIGNSPSTQITSVVVERECPSPSDIVLEHIGNNVFRPTSSTILACRWRFYGLYCYRGGLGQPNITGSFNFAVDTRWEVGDFTLQGPACVVATGNLSLLSTDIDLPITIGNFFVYEGHEFFCVDIANGNIGVTISKGGLSLCAGSSGTTTGFIDPDGVLASTTCQPVSIDWEFSGEV